MRDALGKFISGHIVSKEFREKISETKRKNSLYLEQKSICRCCKKDFLFFPNKYHPTRVFCSKKCKNNLGSMYGKKRSKESKKRLSVKYFGSGNPFWKGGISLNKPRSGKEGTKHRQWRKKLLEKHGRLCNRCGTTEGRFEVDHIKPYSIHPKIRWRLDNGQVLCVSCHKEKTRGERKMFWKNQYGSSFNPQPLSNNP